MWNDVTGQALTFGPNVFFLHNPWSCQLKGHERISPQRCEKCFAEFPLHILALYGSTPYLLKNETVVQVSVKLGIILTCNPNAKVYFAVEKRVNIIEQRNVNWLMWNHVSFTLSTMHSSQLHTLVKLVSDNIVATFNRLNKPVWKYVKKSWGLHVLFLFFILPCIC